jgi:hypothetical protein
VVVTCFHGRPRKAVRPGEPGRVPLGSRHPPGDIVGPVGAYPAIEELYDLGQDPYEEHDLAGWPEHAETLGWLRGRWGRLRKELE